MIRKLFFFSLLLLLLGLNACARTAERGIESISRRIIMQFSVEGQMPLNNDNVTYYIVLNAPSEPGRKLDAATEGPRINGPSLNDTPANLLGRLPFIDLLPGDVTSVWTHFYYLRGTANGRGEVGRGIRREDGTPEIIERNYSDALWRKTSNSSVEIQILFSDLFPEVTIEEGEESPFPDNITVNLASSDNIDTGQGFVYDYWRANLPFEIETLANNTPVEDVDDNTEIILRPIPGKNFPQLPPGVNKSAVNIVSYEFRVQDL